MKAVIFVIWSKYAYITPCHLARNLTRPGQNVSGPGKGLGSALRAGRPGEAAARPGGARRAECTPGEILLEPLIDAFLRRPTWAAQMVTVCIAGQAMMVVGKALLTSLDLQKRILEDHVGSFWKLHLAKLESEANFQVRSSLQFRL
jgi:hypothetical protein